MRNFIGVVALFAGVALVWVSRTPHRPVSQQHVLALPNTPAVILTITSTSNPPAARTGSAYSFQMTAIKASPPYSWFSRDPLPSGLGLSYDGRLSGVPAVAGNYHFMIGVQEPPGTPWRQTTWQTIYLTVQ